MGIGVLPGFYHHLILRCRPEAGLEGCPFQKTALCMNILRGSLREHLRMRMIYLIRNY
jgi:hypothetical protein